MQSLVSIIYTDLMMGGPIARAMDNFQTPHTAGGGHTCYNHPTAPNPPLLKLGQGEYAKEIHEIKSVFDVLG
jgi:hypothetical protein